MTIKNRRGEGKKHPARLRATQNTRNVIREKEAAKPICVLVSCLVEITATRTGLQALSREPENFQRNSKVSKQLLIYFVAIHRLLPCTAATWLAVAKSNAGQDNVAGI